MKERFSPEMREMLGRREDDDDGFTYRYGKHKGGFVKRTRHNNTIDRSVRHDKRAARAKEIRRLERELEKEFY